MDWKTTIAIINHASSGLFATIIPYDHLIDGIENVGQQESTIAGDEIINAFTFITGWYELNLWVAWTRHCWDFRLDWYDLSIGKVLQAMDAFKAEHFEQRGPTSTLNDAIINGFESYYCCGSPNLLADDDDGCCPSFAAIPYHAPS